MRLDCANAEEAISNFARDGVELTEEISRHIEQCESCRQALMEAETVINALGCLRSCPPAPDCRHRVMSQIAPVGSTRLRIAWTAVSLAFALVILITFLPGGRNHRSTHVTIKHNSVQPRHIAVDIGQARKHDIRIAAAPSRPVTRRLPCRHKFHTSRHRDFNLRKSPPTIEVAASGSRDATAGRGDVPVAGPSVKTVCYDEIAYSYTDEDDATGVTIIRHFRQIGDSIDVRIETVSTLKSPTSGMIDCKKDIGA